MNSGLLSVEEITLSFGGLLAVDRVSFEVYPGQIYGVIGPNGAGKTTVFNCISGFYKPDSGNITFNQHPTEGHQSHEIARLGLVRTFQNIRLFKEMTVIENLMVAQHQSMDRRLWAGIIKTGKYRRTEKSKIEQAMIWLEAVDLADMANREAGTLAYGQQRRLEIARCLATNPKMLLLDEPAAGLNPKETDDLDQLIVRLRDENSLTVLLIEHDMRLIMNISDHLLVLDQGRVIASDEPENIRHCPEVIKAYLGES